MKNKFKSIDLNNNNIVNIISTAYEEFCRYGSDRASLNSILNVADVSKGSFYHHFKNKEELHEFLVFFAIRTSYEAIDNDSIWQETDVINRTINSLKLYYEFSGRFPFIFEFLNTMKENEISDFIENNNLTEYNFTNRFYSENIDLSVLKDGVNQEKFIVIVQMVIGEIGKKHFNAIKFHQMEYNVEAMIKEMEEYGEFLRLGYYK